MIVAIVLPRIVMLLEGMKVKARVDLCILRKVENKKEKDMRKMVMTFTLWRMKKVTRFRSQLRNTRGLLESNKKLKRKKPIMRK